MDSDIPSFGPDNVGALWDAIAEVKTAEGNDINWETCGMAIEADNEENCRDFKFFISYECLGDLIGDASAGTAMYFAKMLSAHLKLPPDFEFAEPPITAQLHYPAYEVNFCSIHPPKDEAEFHANVAALVGPVVEAYQQANHDFQTRFGSKLEDLKPLDTLEKLEEAIKMSQFPEFPE